MALFVLRLFSSNMIHFITTTKLPITLNISKKIQTEISQQFKESSTIAATEEQNEIIVLKEKEVIKCDENKDRLSVKLKLENGIVKTLDLVQVPCNTNSTPTSEKIVLHKETYSMGDTEILTYSKEDVKFQTAEVTENKNAPNSSKAILSNRSYCYGIPSSFGTWLRMFNTSKQIVNKKYADFHDYCPNKNKVVPESEIPTVIDIMKDLKQENYNSHVVQNYIKFESKDGFLNFTRQSP